MLPAETSREVLRIVESLGYSGSWSWEFETREQVWSDGFRHILGLPPDVPADYGLMYSLVHPEDRSNVLRPDEVAQLGIEREQTFRILRADGTIRTVSSRGKTFFCPRAVR